MARDIIVFDSYLTLLEKKGSLLAYGELLLSAEWREKREQIIDRDNLTCEKCKTKVKHKFWEYFPFSLKDEEDIGDNLKRRLELHSQSREISLEVHHKLYYQDCLPWEYLDEELTTLCKSCHIKTHEEEKIPVYRSRGNKEFLYNSYDCSRCGGSGILPEFKHVEKGICFSCNGRGRHKIIK